MMDCASPQPALRGRETLAGVVEKAAEVKSMAPPESAGPAPNPSQADAGPPCFAQDCGQPRVRNQKWCSKHKRAYAAMAAQAKKNGQYESFQELVADENRLLIAMSETLQMGSGAESATWTSPSTARPAASWTMLEKAPAMSPRLRPSS